MVMVPETIRPTPTRSLISAYNSLGEADLEDLERAINQKKEELAKITANLQRDIEGLELLYDVARAKLTPGWTPKRNSGKSGRNPNKSFHTVYKYLRDNGPRNLATIQTRTGLSTTTLYKVFNRNAQYFVRTEDDKAVLYSVNKTIPQPVGIDTGSEFDQ